MALNGLISIFTRHTRLLQTQKCLHTLKKPNSSTKRTYTDIVFEKKEIPTNAKNGEKSTDESIKNEKFTKIKKIKLIKADVLKEIESNQLNLEKSWKKQFEECYGSNIRDTISWENELNEGVLKLLLSWHIDMKIIVYFFVNCPLIWKTSEKQVQTTMKVLRKFMYSPEQSLKLLTKCPRLLHDINIITNLQKVLGEIKSLGVEQKKCQVMTLTNPSLIATPLLTIKHNFANILEYFVKSDAISIITKCPNVLSDDWKVSDFKLQYAFHEMGLNSKAIANSKFFSHSVVDILTRHKLLKRLGRYTKPNLKLPDQMGDNPKQKDIFQLNLFNFLKHVASISREEYEVFKESIEGEVARNNGSLKQYFVGANGEGGNIRNERDDEDWEGEEGDSEDEEEED